MRFRLDYQSDPIVRCLLSWPSIIAASIPDVYLLRSFALAPVVGTMRLTRTLEGSVMFAARGSVAEIAAAGEPSMKRHPFLGIFVFFLIIALVVSNLWDFLFRSDHPILSVPVIIITVVAIVAGFLNAFHSKGQ
jgi:RsiW-degrading membrane proteinase PrsW (M82 family)